MAHPFSGDCRVFSGVLSVPNEALQLVSACEDK